ncbi:hypothetical protein [Ramlibacter sp. AN1133]|uniref:hypothetical protein n=1 Tax=Ramlibacter sp. AN1133 TaxID=3133429 RepID=UPI0030BE014C
MKAGLVIIHINQHAIRKNAKEGTRDPVITVKSKDSNVYGHSVEIDGPSTVVYSPDKPLSCGARCWIETTAPVRVIGAAAPPRSGRKSLQR